MYSIIVAADENNGIGKNNQLPWSLKEDMKYFKNVTTKVYKEKDKNVVIMGKNTWYSIPEKFRPLKDRLNIVLTKEKNIKDCICLTSFESALEYVNTLTNINETFVIGGAKLYETAMLNKNLQTIFFTKIHHKFDCDVYFPKITENFYLTYCQHNEENGIKYSFELYKNNII